MRLHRTSKSLGYVSIFLQISCIEFDVIWCFHILNEADGHSCWDSVSALGAWHPSVEWCRVPSANISRYTMSRCIKKWFGQPWDQATGHPPSSQDPIWEPAACRPAPQTVYEKVAWPCDVKSAIMPNQAKSCQIQTLHHPCKCKARQTAPLSAVGSASVLANTLHQTAWLHMVGAGLIFVVPSSCCTMWGFNVFQLRIPACGSNWHSTINTGDEKAQVMPLASSWAHMAWLKHVETTSPQWHITSAHGSHGTSNKSSCLHHPIHPLQGHGSVPSFVASLPVVHWKSPRPQRSAPQVPASHNGYTDKKHDLLLAMYSILI